MPSITIRLRATIARATVIAAAALAIVPSAALAEVYVTVTGAGTVKVTKGSASNVVLTCAADPTTPTGRRGADCRTGAGMFESVGVHVTPAPGYTFAGFLGTSSHCQGQTTTCWYVASGVANDFFYPTFVDETPPGSSFIAGPPALSPNAEARFEFTADQAGSTFQCRLDGGAWSSCSTGHVLGNLADGAHTMSVRAIDPSGNLQPEPSQRTWTVDRTPPAVAILRGGEVPVRERTTFWLGVEAGATVECRSYAIGGVVDPWVTCPSASVVGIAVYEGQQSFEVRARDAAGNVSTAVRRVWVADRTAPRITVTSGPPEDAVVTARTVEFEWSHADATTVTPTCAVDGRAVDCVGSPARFTELTDGSHTTSITLHDAAGNSTSVARSFVVDVTAPVATISGGPAGETRDTTATFGLGVGVTEPGVAFRCSLDGAAFAGCTAPVAMRDLAVGAHTLRVVARDRYGNEQPASQAATRSWTVLAAPAPTPDPKPTPDPQPGPDPDPTPHPNPGPTPQPLPNPAPAPGPGAPTADRTPPTLQVRAAARLALRRPGTALTLQVACSEACTIQVSGSARIGRSRPVQLSAKPVRAAASARTTVRLVVPEAVRRALLAARRGTTARATITVKVRDAAGNTSKRPVTVLLTR